MTDSPTCLRCKAQHITRFGTQGCAGHRRDGAPCGNSPINGARVCRKHGGGAPQVKEAAAHRMKLAKAAEEMRTLGAQRDVMPTDALLEEVRWTAGHVAWLREKVQQLEDEQDLVWGRVREVDKGSGKNPGTDVTEAASTSIWYELYRTERAHLVAVCSAALRAGVEERRVRLAESQGDLVAEVIRRILDDLDLSTDQRAAVATVVPMHLRAIAAG